MTISKKAPKSRKKTKPVRPRGRATTYTEQVAAIICSRIADGETLRAICRDERMPAWRTVYDWMNDRPQFAARFARAREVGFDAIAQQALEIADTPLEGVRIEIDSEGNSKEVCEDMLGHRKLQIETRLKLLAKWSPTKYGDKLQLGGAPDLPPVQQSIQAEVKLSAEESYRRMLNGA